MSVRVNITISDELKKYFEEWSEKTGIAQSSLMSLAMNEYVDQKKALNALTPMLEQMQLLSLASQTEAKNDNSVPITQK